MASVQEAKTGESDGLRVSKLDPTRGGETVRLLQCFRTMKRKAAKTRGSTHEKAVLLRCCRRCCCRSYRSTFGRGGWISCVLYKKNGRLSYLCGRTHPPRFKISLCSNVSHKQESLKRPTVYLYLVYMYEYGQYQLFISQYLVLTRRQQQQQQQHQVRCCCTK